MKALRLALFGLLLLPLAASTQEFRVANFAIDYDLDSTTTVYPRVVGQNGNPYGGSIAGTGTLTSVTTTVTGSDLTGFTVGSPLGAGDYIFVTQAGVTTRVQVASVTDGDTLVLVTAPGTAFAGESWRWLDLQVGATAADGWINVSGMAEKSMSLQYEQGDGDISVRWECRKSWIGASPEIIYPGEGSDCGVGGTLTSAECVYAAAAVGITNRVTLLDFTPFQECRIGIKLTGADASDAAANLEKITLGVENRLAR